MIPQCTNTRLDLATRKMNREQLADASAVAAKNGSIGSTGAMALAARLLNDRSSHPVTGENRCWGYSYITGMHNRALGRVCTPAARRCGGSKAVLPDLRTLTCGSFELRRNAKTNWQMEEH